MLLTLQHVIAGRETTPPAEDLDKEDLDDEDHDEVAASNVESNDEDLETTAKDAEASAKDALSMGSDGEL